MNVRKQLFFFLVTSLLIKSALGQNYDHILNFNINTTPTHGVKIKTNLPFQPGAGMPTISIQGYNYGSNEPIGLTLIYYVWYAPLDTPDYYYFHNPRISSSGSYTPRVFLSNENGKVVIFIDDRVYFQRFTVSAFGQGEGEQAAWFTGWTAVDEPMYGGTKTLEVPYQNRFKGDVIMPGTGIWNATGNVGIGTSAPAEKLSVNGNIRAKEIKVETTNWPDYVFKPDYKLPSLVETEKHILEKGHLPGIPSAKDAERNGISLSEMNAKLLQKIEELTLHLIAKDKELKEEKAIVQSIHNRLKLLEEKQENKRK